MPPNLLSNFRLRLALRAFSLHGLIPLFQLADVARRTTMRCMHERNVQDVAAFFEPLFEGFVGHRNRVKCR